MKKKSARSRRVAARQKGLAKPLVIIGVVIVGLIVFFAATGSFKFEARIGNDKNQQAATDSTDSESNPVSEDTDQNDPQALRKSGTESGSK